MWRCGYLTGKDWSTGLCISGHGVKPGTIIGAPSLGLVICKMGGNNGQYDPKFTTIPQPEPSTARDDWKPIVGTPFIEGCRGGDDGIRRVLEMVSAAVRL